MRAAETGASEPYPSTPYPSTLGPLSRRILDLIRERGLRSGDPMPTEVELIDVLAVSRNSVREALRSLRTLGIIEVRHGYGTVVGEPSLHVLSPSLVFRTVTTTSGVLDELRNLVEIRELIETGVVERLAGTVPESTLDALDELCDTMTRSPLDPETDRAFHRRLYAEVDNPLVGQLIDVFWDAYHAGGAALDAPKGSETAQTLRRHRAIVAALRSGDGTAARSAMTDHFAEIKRRLDTARSTAP
ncbi:FadR/GntR family transcriptional regulator [Saccharopolyspora sp. CA-218241]|uniref:FadR/GntR family transcriptional regulator n=1 Tax=Saccharopolyspora sp. CA-218241 TaxID=3240027 RepID=UPI003D998BBF